MAASKYIAVPNLLAVQSKLAKALTLTTQSESDLRKQLHESPTITSGMPLPNNIAGKLNNGMGEVPFVEDPIPKLPLLIIPIFPSWLVQTSDYVREIGAYHIPPPCQHLGCLCHVSGNGNPAEENSS